MAKKTKDLKYWLERGGQIEWRLTLARSKVSEIECDLDECDEQIKILREQEAQQQPPAESEGE